jgi:hypothetical protein
MSANKPKFIEKFWPYTKIKSSRGGKYKEILAQRMEYSKYLIENTFGVKAERVVDIFIKAFVASDKDYPSPIDAVQSPSNSKDYDLYNQYIVFLWEYYVKDKSKKPKPQKENKPTEVKKTNFNDNSEKLSLYDGIKEEDLVDEEIDERVLKLLGLKDIFDIDYGTYLTLLKERMIVGRMNGSKIPTEETALLTEEWKRVKGKVGRFKIKSKKINADNIKTTGPIRITKDKFFLAGKVSVPSVETPEKENLEFGSLKKDIQAIRFTVENIEKSLLSQSKLLQKDYESQNRRRENRSREDKESKLESVGNFTKSLVQKIIAPVQGILDRIINFIVNMLLGKFFVELLNWFSDKGNQEKIKNIGRFLKDWWPSLLGAYLLFGTSFGKLFRNITGMLAKFTIKLAKKSIPSLMRFVSKNPLVAAGAITGLAAGAGYMMEQKNRNKIIEKEAKAEGKTPKQKSKEIEVDKSWFDRFGEAFQSGQLGMGGISPIGLKNGGIVPQPSILDIKDIGFDGGGQITNDTGLRVTGAGKDTQLIAGQPGEIMINKPTVDALGKDFFLSLNTKYGGSGANMPSMYNNIQLASTGGMIGPKVEKNEKYTYRGKPLSMVRKDGTPSTKYSTNKNGLAMNLRNRGNNVNYMPNNSKKYSIKNNFYGAARNDSKPFINPRSINLINNTIPQNNFMYGVNVRRSDINIDRPIINKSTNIQTADYSKERSNKTIIPSKKSPYIPPPLLRSKTPNIIALPSKKSNSTGPTQSHSGNRTIPPFSAYQENSNRKNNIHIYGIVGVE